MQWFLVSWMALSCPGGALKGMIPKTLRPLVCDSIPASKLYASEMEALDKLREQGPTSSLQICHEVKGLMACTPAKVSWEPVRGL